MKRVLGIALALVSMGFVVSAEAKTANVSSEVTTVANAAPQWQRDRYGRRITIGATTAVSVPSPASCVMAGVSTVRHIW